MKNQLFQVSTMLILFARLAVAQVYPPTPGDLKVTIPFDFIVGSQVLSAGNYIVHKDGAPDALQICEEGVTCTTAVTRPLQTPEIVTQPGLVFRRYRDQYFLCQVRSTSDSGRQLPPSCLELESEGSKGGQPGETVDVNAQFLCVHLIKGLPTSWH
jgi:hypothetical protein